MGLFLLSLVTFVALCALPSSAHANLGMEAIGFLEDTREMDKAAEQMVRQIITPGGAIGRYIGMLILVGSAFFFFRMVQLINAGRAGEPIWAFGKLIINAVIITIMATQSGSLITSAKAIQDGFQNTIKAGMKTLGINGNMDAAIVQARSRETLNNATKNKAAVAEIATQNPERAGIPWTPANVDYFKKNNRGISIVKIESNGTAYIGLYADSTNEIEGAERKLVSDPKSDHEIEIKNGKPVIKGTQITGSKLMLAPISESMINLMISQQVSPKKRSGPNKLTPPKELQKTIAESVAEQRNKTASEGALEDAVREDTGNWFIDGYQKLKRSFPFIDTIANTIRDFLGKLAKGWAYIAIIVLNIVTRAILYGSILIMCVTSPLLLYEKTNMQSAFWNACKGLVMALLLPGIALFVNAFVWGVIFDPLSRLPFFELINLLLLWTPMACIWLVYPIIVWIVTFKAGKAFFNGDNFVGAALAAGVTLGKAALTIGAAAATGGAAGLLAAKATGGNMMDMLKGAVGGAAEVGSGLLSGGTTGAIAGGVSSLLAMNKASKEGTKTNLGSRPDNVTNPEDAINQKATGGPPPGKPPSTGGQNGGQTTGPNGNQPKKGPSPAGNSTPSADIIDDTGSQPATNNPKTQASAIQRRGAETAAAKREEIGQMARGGVESLDSAGSASTPASPPATPVNQLSNKRTTRATTQPARQPAQQPAPQPAPQPAQTTTTQASTPAAASPAPAANPAASPAARPTPMNQPSGGTQYITQPGPDQKIVVTETQGKTSFTVNSAKAGGGKLPQTPVNPNQAPKKYPGMDL
jgi:hypothetical protein